MTSYHIPKERRRYWVPTSHAQHVIADDSDEDSVNNQDVLHAGDDSNFSQGEHNNCVLDNSHCPAPNLDVPPNDSLFEKFAQANKAQFLTQMCSPTSQERLSRNSQHLSLDFTPFQQEEVLQYSIDKDGDASLQSFQCPSTYKEMIIIIHELRKQRHLALQSFEFNPPIIPLNSLNFSIPNNHISNSKIRNFENVTSSSLITSEYDDV